jgi:hypothetical protein
VNLPIKSETNQLHGALFEFVRNDRFDARGFFLAPTQSKNELRRNQFAPSLRGPIRRNHTLLANGISCNSAGKRSTA